jgi:hypothetical protein
MNSFYTGGVQQVSKYLRRQAPGTVTFVYKDGRFPGEEDTAGGPNLGRISGANDESLARTSGQQLASFESGMRTDPYLNDAEQTGIGHSWGLTNVTSSEVAGARYDKVISLAGAGMLPDWKLQPTTEYSNLYYYDVLIHGEGVTNPITNKGVVWDGNNPNPIGETGAAATARAQAVGQGTQPSATRAGPRPRLWLAAWDS